MNQSIRNVASSGHSRASTSHISALAKSELVCSTSGLTSPGSAGLTDEHYGAMEIGWYQNARRSYLPRPGPLGLMTGQRAKGGEPYREGMKHEFMSAKLHIDKQSTVLQCSNFAFDTPPQYTYTRKQPKSPALRPTFGSYR